MARKNKKGQFINQALEEAARKIVSLL